MSSSLKKRKIFLIYCKNPKTAGYLRGLIYDNIFGSSTYIALNQDNTYQVILTKKIDVFIVEMDPYEEKDEQFLETLYLNTKSFFAPLIILTPTHKKSQRLSIPCHCLQKPFEANHFIELILKLSVQKKRAQIQESKRYRTRQMAYVKSFLKEEKFYPLHIYNLSKTGAYFEHKSLPPWEVGEILNIKIVLDDLNLEHNLSAKLMWINNEGSIFGGHGFGVKFISEQDVQTHLIETTEKKNKIS